MLKLSIIVSKKNNLSQHIVGPGGLVKTVVHMRACVCAFHYWALKFLKALLQDQFLTLVLIYVVL